MDTSIAVYSCMLKWRNGGKLEWWIERAEVLPDLVKLFGYSTEKEKKRFYRISPAREQVLVMYDLWLYTALDTAKVKPSVFFGERGRNRKGD
jgi:hypothetical protein